MISTADDWVLKTFRVILSVHKSAGYPVGSVILPVRGSRLLPCSLEANYGMNCAHCGYPRHSTSCVRPNRRVGRLGARTTVITKIASAVCPTNERGMPIGPDLAVRHSSTFSYTCSEKRSDEPQVSDLFGRGLCRRRGNGRIGLINISGCEFAALTVRQDRVVPVRSE